MQSKFLQAVEDKHKKADVPDFQVGDTIIVHQKLLDGQKERIQTFEGDVIARNGAGVKEMMVVRKIVQGEGVERIFLVHSPRIAKIEIKYTSPAHYDDLLTGRTTVVRTTPVRLEHQYQMFRENGTLVCEGSSTLACVDREGKLQAMPTWLEAR